MNVQPSDVIATLTFLDSCDALSQEQRMLYRNLALALAAQEPVRYRQLVGTHKIIAWDQIDV